MSARMQSLSPVLITDAIEPCLPFWTDRLGYELCAQIEHGGRIGFALLVKDGVTIMYQSRASVADDLPQLEGRDLDPSACLYIGVDDLDAVETSLAGVERVVERRTTFYGKAEIAVREPAGSLVIFAQDVGAESA